MILTEHTSLRLSFLRTPARGQTQVMKIFFAALAATLAVTAHGRYCLTEIQIASVDT